MEEVGNVVRMEVASSGNYWGEGQMSGVLPNGSRGVKRISSILYIELFFAPASLCHIFFNMWSFLRNFEIGSFCHVHVILYHKRALFCTSS